MDPPCGEAEVAFRSLIARCLEADTDVALARLAERLPEITARQNALHVLDALVNYDVRPIPAELADALLAWLARDDDLIYVSVVRCLGLCAWGGIARVRAVAEPSGVRRRLRDAALWQIERGLGAVEPTPSS